MELKKIRINKTVSPSKTPATGKDWITTEGMVDKYLTKKSCKK